MNRQTARSIAKGMSRKTELFCANVWRLATLTIVIFQLESLANKSILKGSLKESEKHKNHQ
jgi:hypothetical protein